MKRTFAFGAATQQGQWPVQEDGYFVDPVSGFMALADGFGGKGCGDLAAKAALLDVRKPLPKGGGAQPHPLGPEAARHRELVLQANRALLAWNEKRSPNARGGCSVVLASANRELRELVLTSCGACSAWLLRDGQWLQILAPQASPRSMGEDLLFPDQALGLAGEILPETRAISWAPGDMYFLFSGALAWPQEVLLSQLRDQALLREPHEGLEGLVSLAVSGQDAPAFWNTTALALEVF